MSNSFTDIEATPFAERIGGAAFLSQTGSYKFAQIAQARKDYLEQPDRPALLDLSIGEPKSPPSSKAHDALIAALDAPRSHLYTDTGVPEFLTAARLYTNNEFDLNLEPHHVAISMGSKAVLGHLALAFLNQGDYFIGTTPSYPVFNTYAQYMGAHSYLLPLAQDKQYMPDFSDVPTEVAKNAKVLLLNYPNSPTGTGATRSFYREALAFAAGYDMIVLQDAAYGFLQFEKPLSILTLPGAMERTVELFSMSKAHNMTGWRLGWLCGNPDLLKAYNTIRTTSDSGQYAPIQYGALAALQDKAYVQNNKRSYRRRILKLTALLKTLGFSGPMPQGGFFAYFNAPKTAVGETTQHEFKTAFDFAQWMIYDLGICAVPWDEVEPSIRFSLTFKAGTEADENRFLDEVYARLNAFKFTF